MTEEQANKELESTYEEAKKILNDPDKLERFLQKLEKKLASIPKIGNELASVPLMISLVRNYAKKNYTDIPMGSLIAIVGALIYFLSPIDVIPDKIPGVGLVDDAFVVLACLKLVGSDLDDYKKWKNEFYAKQ